VSSKKLNLDKVNIKADSELGSKLMANARRVEENADVDFTYVAGYSIKFQGCHSIQQWNDEADGEEDVRIATKRLVRFRLCPTDSCTTANAGGCNSGYGEYIIDMNIFLQAYMQSVETYNEYRCEYLQQMVCACNDDDGNQQDDGFDEDICLWDCYVANGVEDICADRNPYNEDEQQQEEAFKLEEYMECGRFEVQDNDDANNRRLDQQEVEYYLGPYCSDNGGAIFLGMFTDDTCTTFADAYGGKSTYQTLAKTTMPYSETSVIELDCLSCKEPEDFNNDGNDNEDGDEVAEVCEAIYAEAGKCESSMGIDNPNTNACTYMEGIKIVRKNGIITQNSSKGNKTASVFIGIFVVAFVLLAAYVYYLKTKLDRASINLAE
jgi:hypothetical protein